MPDGREAEWEKLQGLNANLRKLLDQETRWRNDATAAVGRVSADRDRLREAGRAVLDAADLAAERVQRVEPTKVRLAIQLLRVAMAENADSTTEGRDG